MARLTRAQKPKTQDTTLVVRGVGIEEPDQEPFLGLCAICVQYQSCAFRRDVAEAVLECGEFDFGTAAPAKNEPPAVTEGAAVPDEPSPFKGLCVNCDARLECRLPRPEEGVWHCEYYV